MYLYEFQHYITEKFKPYDPQAKCPIVTFQVTEDCCLKCSYCYQINKTHKMMSLSTAKEIVDFIYQLYERNDPDMPINHHAWGIALEFIGGEPFLNTEVIEDTITYFIQEGIKRDHIWLDNFRVSIPTNGMLYFSEPVQHLFKRYHNFISLTVSIDGPKHLHDSCRVDENGQGSFDTAIVAMRHYRDVYCQGRLLDIKVTIAPENLPYLDEIFEFFLAENAIGLNANPIFEHCWTIEEAKIFYKKLLHLADVLLSESSRHPTFLFSETDYRPLTQDGNTNYCGGTGGMLAFDPDGQAYPCLRYMSTSLGTDQPPLVIGNTHNIYTLPEHKKILNEFKSITRDSQSTDECLNCSIAIGCGWCSAYNYQLYGTCNKRCTNCCWMHRARSLANVYYWNLYYHKHSSEKRFPLYLDKSLALQLISADEYDNLLELSL